MRRPSSTLRSLAAATVLTSAVLAGGTAPAQAAASGQLGGATFYEHAHYGGTGLRPLSSGGACVNLYRDWQNRISSLGSVTGRVHLYTLGNCLTDAPHQEFTSDTPYVGDALNDKVKSYRIW